MSLPRILSAGVVLFGVLLPGTSEAHRPYWLGRRPIGLFNQCCAPVHHPCCAPAIPIDPCGVCGPAMQPVFQTQLRPVTQTTLVPQQVVTYQTVPQIQYQRQAYIEQVPVTTWQNVTRYRDVAVQVNQQVAQVQTQLVPQQTLGYIPETRAIGMQYTGPQIVGWNGGLPIYGSVPLTAGLPIAAQSGEPVPEPIDALPTGSTNPTSQYMQGASGNEWSTIRQRSQGTSAAQPPSAATVWQSQLQSGAVAR